MSFPLINPQSQFFDSSGSPLVSGTIEFRSPTDDTYINTYPTADDADAQTNANANPLTLNARGEAASGIYLEDGVKYKITLRERWPDELTPGTVVWTQDDVLCPIAATYPQTSVEAASGITPANYEYPPGNVLRYGADPTGVASSVTAINNALVYNLGGKVIIPKGVYLIDGPILLRQFTTLEGENLGRNDTTTFGVTLTAAAGYAGYMLYPANFDEGGDDILHEVRVANLNIDGGGTASGINFGESGDCSEISRLRISDCVVGLNVGQSSGRTAVADGQQLASYINSVSFYSCTTGLKYTGCAYTASATNLMFDGNTIHCHVLRGAQNFHLNFTQVHVENIGASDELFRIEDSQNWNGFYGVTCSGTGNVADWAVIKIMRGAATAANKARVVAHGISVEVAKTAYVILEDDWGGESYTQGDLTLTGHTLFHNINVRHTGQGTIHTENFRTASTGLYVAANDGTDSPSVQYYTGDYAARNGFINFDDAIGCYIRNEVHGAPVVIQSEDTAGTVRTILNADPDADTVITGDINVSIEAGAGTEASRIEDPSTLSATETSLWLYDKDNTTLTQVLVGAADSGGSGYKLLKIPN